MTLTPDFLYRDSSLPIGVPGSGTFLPTTGAGGWSPSSTYINYYKVGRLVFFNITIAGNASATGYVTVTMPFYSAYAMGFSGKEYNVTGLVCGGAITAGSNQLTVSRYDNGSPGGTPGGGGNTGVIIAMSGWYEATS